MVLHGKPFETLTGYFYFQILNEIGSNKIGIYQFPDLGIDDEDFKDVSMTVS